MATIIETRIANALFKEAKMSPEGVEALAKAAGELGAGKLGDAVKGGAAAAAPVLQRFAEHYGGLWVGGKATLTNETFSFAPNALNRLVHADGAALRLDLPVAAIEQVTTRFGWFTGIVDIDAAAGSRFTLRCYGSKRFAGAIAAAAGVAVTAG